MVLEAVCQCGNTPTLTRDFHELVIKIINMLKPLGDKILLRVPTVEDAEATASGIFLPDSAKNPENEDMRRIVVSVGPDTKNKGLKKNASVLLTQLSMREKYHDGVDVYEIVKETDILGII